jgi:hypoxanthine phosphoribosyltransferase
MNSQDRLNILIPAQEIANIVRKLAYEVRNDYQGSNPILIGILKGSFIFLADLIRHINIPLEVEFIEISSYGKCKNSSGKISIQEESNLIHRINERHIIIVEDIVDTGLSIKYLMDYVKKGKPASLKICSLTDKPSGRITPVTIDYLGISVPNKFIVGYGLDYNEKYRNLPDIYTLED